MTKQANVNQQIKYLRLKRTLQSCANDEELQRIQNLISNTTDPNGDFATLSAVYNDLLTSGDNIFGTAPDQSLLEQIKQRNKDLKDKKINIQKQLKRMIQRLNEPTVTLSIQKKHSHRHFLKKQFMF